MGAGSKQLAREAERRGCRRQAAGRCDKSRRRSGKGQFSLVVEKNAKNSWRVAMRWGVH